MFCKNCGKDVVGTDKCYYCGAALNSDEYAISVEHLDEAKTAMPAVRSTDTPSDYTAGGSDCGYNGGAPNGYANNAPQQSYQANTPYSSGGSDYGYNGGMPNGYANNAPQQSNQTNTIAIIGFILSIVGMFGGLPGLFISITGLRKSRELNGNGRNIAIAGIVFGIIAFVISAIAIFALTKDPDSIYSLSCVPARLNPF